MDQDSDYNKRLFAGKGLRHRYHIARFLWLQRQLERLPQHPLRVIELGCFDAKTVYFIRRPVERYVGLDANWEGGLDFGRRAFAGRQEIELREIHSPEALKTYPDASFDTAVSLETLEHLPPESLDDYLRELARVTRGAFYASVPNEMGPLFLAKYLAKRLRYGDADDYTFGEIVAATMRRMGRVARDEHKGFDYRALARQIGRHFHVTRVEGVPHMGLPAALSPTIGIVAESKHEPDGDASNTAAIVS